MKGICQKFFEFKIKFHVLLNLSITQLEIMANFKISDSSKIHLTSHMDYVKIKQERVDLKQFLNNK